MIETGKQARKAIKTIKRRTDWSGAEIGRRLGVTRQVIFLIESGHTKRPSGAVMTGLDELLEKVEQL